MEAASRLSTLETSFRKLTVYARSVRSWPQERSWRFPPGLVYFRNLFVSLGIASVPLSILKQGGSQADGIIPLDRGEDILFLVPSALSSALSSLLAHLWGAYAIPVALSVVCRMSCVVCVHQNYQK